MGDHAYNGDSSVVTGESVTKDSGEEWFVGELFELHDGYGDNKWVAIFYINWYKAPIYLSVYI